MGTKVSTTADGVKWLMGDESRISLFLEIARAGLVKREVDERVRQLLYRGLIRYDQYGIRLTVLGKKVFETIQAISQLDEVK